MAVCQRCRGKGRIPDGVHRAGGFVVGIGEKPCPECNGCGQESCCVGHEGQPEADE